MKSSTLKVIAEVRSLFELCAELGVRIPSLKDFAQSLKSLSDWLSTLPSTVSEQILGPCLKPADMSYNTAEQKILSSLTREKLLLCVCYLRASRDKNLDQALLAETQEMIDQQD